MFEIAANISEVLGGLLFLVWALAGYRAGRLAFGGRRRWIVVLVTFGVLTLLAQVALVVVLWTIDWEFASNRVVLAIPPVAIPVCVLSLRRPAVSDPRFVVPIQSAAIGAFLDFWVVFVDRPVPPYAGYALVLWAILLAATGLLWWRHRRRHRAFTGPNPPVSSRPVVRIARTAGVLVVAGALVFATIAIGQRASRLPDRLSMSPHHGARSAADLTGPRTGVPDVKFTLTAQETRIRLSSGRTVDAWTFNGQAPGPELRMRQGDLVEVTLVNRLPDEGVTVHWHGLDVPNAEDGVAGVTQDATPPGGTHVYRFRAEQVGSFWYHSHQVSDAAVNRGLFGPLVVLPRGADVALDLPVMVHTWTSPGGRAEALGTSDTLERRSVPPGTKVRLRLINTSDNFTHDLIPRTLVLTGTPFRVTAIDGVDLNQPSDLENAAFEMAIGGRYDVVFTMPDHPVRLTDLLNPDAGLVLGAGPVPPVPSEPRTFDPAAYGKPAPTPFDASSRFDRRFRLVLDDGPGFYDGRFTFPPTINGKVFPDTPMLMVDEGELIKTTIINRGHQDHPMHLHGHHVLVLSRNRKPVSGSPWWTDTLEVLPGQIYEVAFRADNPGIWMDHCHNLAHAATGMIMHLAYHGVTSPYQVGHVTKNHPE